MFYSRKANISWFNNRQCYMIHVCTYSSGNLSLKTAMNIKEENRESDNNCE